MKKIILVTGATDGIGKKTAERLLNLGHHVVVHGRSADRVQSTVRELETLTQGRGQIESCVFDLGSLQAIRNGARDLLGRLPKLDVLLNNAGTYQTHRNVSPDGFELTMAINHLGPTLLTFLLKPLLKKSPQPRVIFVASVAHNRGHLDPINFNFETRFEPYPAYATSKLANVITAQRLAQEWSEDRIPVYSLHPGVITTKLLKMGFNIEGDSVENGSETSLYLATSPIEPSLNGHYFENSRPQNPSPKTNDQTLTDTFWKWTKASVGITN